MKNLRAARQNWGKNHRHQGGLPSLVRCWRGQRALEAMGVPRTADPSVGLEVLSFSVVPWLTALWGRCLQPALAACGGRLVIGDCSGGLRRPWTDLVDGVPMEVLPCLNHHHGDKLDLFVAKVCRGRRVLVCDDDIFWRQGGPPSCEPLEWALGRLAEDPGLAVVSLAPRTLVSSVLEGRIEEPMGSSCLLLRRDLWLREGLSFRMAPAPDRPGADWFYDTCDRANLELLEAGHRILVAPPEIRAGLVSLEAVSAWILKAQKHPPERLAEIADLPVRRTKALRALVTAGRLARLAQRLADRLTSPGERPLADVAGRLEAAAAAVAARVPEPEREGVLAEVEGDLARIESSLPETPGELSGPASQPPRAGAPTSGG